ncbi:DinB family protein [Ulvibacter antarcticus]|uniref:DinB family protein n=1 Tax=Ulvibacter antarcticus TaxID=442714 RepID=A0A3L9YJA0_9FLAO|nr:DinB family protein [Ulvibacter antarcticus]RMA58008.1 DinB family protein [Ulvibacter antarcticus]
MKKTILILVVLFLGSASFSYAQLQQTERDIAIEELSKTKAHLLESLDGLSEEQLNFKAAPDSWSIAECVEHIALSENNIFGLLEKSLETEADPSKRSEVAMTDEAILMMIVDRSNKLKTQAPFEPTGKFGSHDATLKAYLSKRKENTDFVKNTTEDLRNHYAQLPFGTMDAYQVLLFMSAHNERHVLQIEEVMDDEDFPSS